MNRIDATLDELLAELDAKIRRRGGDDAIAQVLAGPRRQTSVQSLHNHEVVRRFRRELVDGLIRVDTANQLLRLIQLAVRVATGV